MNTTLPNWFERLLGVETPSAGEGTAWSVEHAWTWAPWVTLLAAAALAALVIVIYLREGSTAGRWTRGTLIALRLGLFLLVAFMLAEVVLTLQRTGLPYVAVLVDTSGSMSTADRYRDESQRSQFESRAAANGFDEATRLNLAKSVLLENDAALLRGLADEYRLRLYYVAQGAELQGGELAEWTAGLRDVEALGEATRLGAGIRQVLGDLRGTPPAALVLLTDGINTDGESLVDAAELARRKNVPLLAVAIGDDQPVRDIELADLLVDEVVFVDDIMYFDFKVTASGYEGRRVDVVLRQREDSTPLARLDVQLGADGVPQRVRLPYRPTEVGEFEYVVEIEPLDDEVNPGNNSQKRVVSVRKEQIRVLLVQSYPSYEFRYLKHLLERDSTVELKTVLQEADPEYAEQDRTALRVFPMRREELFDFDVLIFGDVDPSFMSVSVMDNISAFVQEKGGGLVFIAGPVFSPLAFRDTPLAPLFPIELENSTVPQGDASTGFVVQPTDLGWASPPMQLGDTPDETESIWQNLPPLYWFFEAAEMKPAARVLAVHPTRLSDDGQPLPLFALQYAGAGKVLYHATDDTWRWRYQVGDVYFARYWVQTIRFLSRAKLLGKDRSAELTTDRREYRRGESVRLRVRFVDERLAPADDEGVTVVLEQEGHQRRQITLRRSTAGRGIFEGVFPRSSEGSYHAWVATPTLEGRAPATDFVVVVPPGEFERLQVDKAALQRACDDSRGRLFTMANVAQLRKALPKGRQIPVEALPPIALWNKWPLLLLFLTMIVSEWILRKRLGLM